MSDRPERARRPAGRRRPQRALAPPAAPVAVPQRPAQAGLAEHRQRRASR